MQPCDIHPSIPRDKYCKDPSCSKLLCSQCVAAHDSAHNVVDYGELVGELRLAKDQHMISRIAGIGARKALLQELEKMLQRLAERQSLLLEEAKRTEKEVPRILKGIGNRVAVQKEQIAERIHEVSKIVNNDREELIDELEKLTTQADINLNEPLDEPSIRQLLEKYENKSEEQKVTNEFKDRLKEINEVINDFNSFNPYEYFRELAKMYEDYESIQMEEKNIDAHMKLWTALDSTAKTSLAKSQASLSKDRTSFCGFVTVQELAKKLNDILKSHNAAHKSSRSVDELLNEVESLCSKSSGTSPKRPPAKRDRGRTVLIGKKGAEEKAAASVRPPTGLNEASKATPRTAMSRVASRSEISPRTVKKEQLDESTKDEAKSSSRNSMGKTLSKRELSTSRIKKGEVKKEEGKPRKSMPPRPSSRARKDLNDSERENAKTTPRNSVSRTGSRGSLHRTQEETKASGQPSRIPTKTGARPKSAARPTINLVKVQPPNKSLMLAEVSKSLILSIEAMNEVIKGKIVNLKSMDFFNGIDQWTESVKKLVTGVRQYELKSERVPNSSFMLGDEFKIEPGIPSEKETLQTLRNKLVDYAGQVQVAHSNTLCNGCAECSGIGAEAGRTGKCCEQA